MDPANESTTSPGVFTRIMNGLTRMRLLLANLLFVLVLVVLAAVWISSLQRVQVPENAALVLNPRGVIVESLSYEDPLQSLLVGGMQTQEVELQGLLQAIRHGALDENIKLLLLDLDELQWAAPAHTQRLGEALQGFKAGGKKVIAYGHYYTQAGYHLASYADALYMHPMGQVMLEGFGGFNFYIKELLDNFGVNVHVFRVGEYKSAVEPFIRNDMSAESRMASEALFQNLWQHVVADIAENRKIEKQNVQEYADNLAAAVTASQGDMARAALENYLIDELLTVDQANVRVADDVGVNRNGDINGIDYLNYLSARSIGNYGGESRNSDRIAVIIAQGMIVTSEQSGQGNVAAAEPLIELIRRARQNPDIKGLVLRVDSPGGSQFASELIRQELELVQLAGKPVVASFGATAASGGYWIAATADAIVSEPTTITGSIGIFSIATTFENSLKKYGVHTDGVGTTETTLGMSPFTGINGAMARVFQAQVEHGYEQFINLVARGREMPVVDVKAVAEGRVWSGDVARELGLVDELGGLQTALRKAAELAEVTEWSSVRLAPPVDARSFILSQLLAPETDTAPAVSFNNNRSISAVTRGLRSALRTLNLLDDPLNLYTLCPVCLSAQP